MVASKDEVYELKHKRVFQLSWKQEFSRVVLEDVGKMLVEHEQEHEHWSKSGNRKTD